MKKWCYILLAVLAITKFSNAQTLNITGTVKDVNNKPISLVSVVIEKQKSGIATDNSGNFKLSVPKYSRLVFSSVGYKDTVIIIKDESPLNIILLNTEEDLGNVTVTDYQQRAQTNNDLKREIISAEFLHYSAENGIATGGLVNNSGVDASGLGAPVPYHTVSFAKGGGMNYGTAFPEFHSKEDTKGSLYLFSRWLNGLVANNMDSNLLDDKGNYYNINKITGELVMTRDFQSALNLDKRQVKFATLYDSLKNTYTFLLVPLINPTLMCQVIALGNNYDIFKLTTTKFKKADFHTDGFASSGNNYDEYADETAYYFLDLKTNALQKFDLKKKTIKQIFANIPKANDYFSQHKSDDVNDAFLKGLGNYINNDSK